MGDAGEGPKVINFIWEDKCFKGESYLKLVPVYDLGTTEVKTRV